MSEAVEQKVEQVLDCEIRPGIQMDGGDIELVDVSEGVVTVRLGGACAGCPMRTMTLTGFVEERLRQAIPEITKVVAE